MIPSVDSGGLLTVTSTTFWRPTSVAGIDENGNPSVVGVGTTADVGVPVLDTSDSRFTKVSQQHSIQLPRPGTYTVEAFSCCRVGGIINAAEDSWRLTSTVYWDGATASTPLVFNFSAVQSEVVRGSNYVGNLAAIGSPGLTLSYDQALALNISSQPPGFAIDTNTGSLSIPAASTATYLDNPSANVGADYAFSGNIFARNSQGDLRGRVQFDWLFDAVNAGSNLAPVLNDAAVTTSIGDNVNHVFTGADPNNDAITWSFVGLLGPGGASPAIAPTFNASTQRFAWNTAGSIAGTWIAQVRGSDPAGLTDVGSLTITLEEQTAITVDVRSAQRAINLANIGVIPILIFTTSNFNAASVDVTTVRLAGAAPSQTALQDADGDGDLDLVLHFRTLETALIDLYRDAIVSDLADGTLNRNRQRIDLAISGLTTNGTRFEGEDEVDLFLTGKPLRDFLASL